MVVNDEQLFRELKDRFGSPYGFGVYFRGGMGAESIGSLRDLDLDLEAASLRDTIKTSKGQKQQRLDQAPEGRLGVSSARRTAGVDDPRSRAGDPAGAAPRWCSSTPAASPRRT